jgi:hypothetical protein
VVATRRERGRHARLPTLPRAVQLRTSWARAGHAPTFSIGGRRLCPTFPGVQVPMSASEPWDLRDYGSVEQLQRDTVGARHAGRWFGRGCCAFFFVTAGQLKVSKRGPEFCPFNTQAKQNWAKTSWPRTGRRIAPPTHLRLLFLPWLN